MSAVPRSMSAASLDRRIQMLRTAMGPLIAAALEDPDVVEIMLNPDRTLWVDRLSTGRAPMGVELAEADGERIIRLVAAHVGAEVHRGQPLLTGLAVAPPGPKPPCSSGPRTTRRRPKAQHEDSVFAFRFQSNSTKAVRVTASSALSQKHLHGRLKRRT